MRVFLNGQELKFVEGGYKYVFLKPYKQHVEDTVERAGRTLHIQMYDNGVQIRTLATPSEITTLINREVAIDRLNNKIYILEEDSQVIRNDDGSISVK